MEPDAPGLDVVCTCKLKGARLEASAFSYGTSPGSSHCVSPVTSFQKYQSGFGGSDLSADTSLTVTASMLASASVPMRAHRFELERHILLGYLMDRSDFK